MSFGRGDIIRELREELEQANSARRDAVLALAMVVEAAGGTVRVTVQTRKMPPTTISQRECPETGDLILTTGGKH